MIATRRTIVTKRLIAALIIALAAAPALATQSSKTTCETLLADNATGDISPQDLRDCSTESVPFLDGTHTVAFLQPDGSAVTPMLAFSDAALGNDHGFFWSEASDYIGVAINGVEEVSVSATHATFAGIIVGATGAGTCAEDTITFTGSGATNTSGVDLTSGAGDLRLCRAGVSELLVGATDTRTAQDFVPTADGTIDLGSAALTYANGYFLNILADDAGGYVTIPAIDNDGTFVDFGDTIVTPNGTAAEVAYGFAGDTDNDTGMILTSEDRMSIVTNGVARFAFGETTHTLTGIVIPGSAANDLGRNGDPWDEIWLTDLRFDEVDIPTLTSAECDAAAEVGRLSPHDDGTDSGMCYCGDDGGTPGWYPVATPTGFTCP
jgi:hypothetical protein